VASSGSSPSTPAQQAERAQAILQLLSRLPSDERVVVHLRHFEGRTLAEIATAIGRTPAATAGLLKRAMARLSPAAKRLSV
jgi:RNA polymerase sigma-70 factor (ECF subfamily)